MLLGLVIYLICRPFFFKRAGVLKNFLICLMFIYAGAIFSLTISPILLPDVLHTNSNSFSYVLHAANFVPFKTTLLILYNGLTYNNTKAIIYNLGGNFVMLMPLGLLVPLIFKRVRFLRMALIAVLAAVFIESMQLLENFMCGFIHRDVNIDDVIFNAIGCIAVYIVFADFRKLYEFIFHRKKAARN